MPNLKVLNETNRDGIIYFELVGILDAHNFETLESLFDRHFESGFFRFVVDIKKLEYVSSAGAGVFIGVVGTCQENDGNVVLVEPSREVKEIFELLGVYQIFPVAKGREEAFDLFTKKAV